jgi:hypothetical protein
LEVDNHRGNRKFTAGDLSSSIPQRYRTLESSGLEWTVEAGRNRFDIRLEPPPS